jgi:hypothetical protein
MQMKRIWTTLVIASTLVFGLAIAQQDAQKNDGQAADLAAPPPIPPIPPKVPGEELAPSVVITQRGEDRIEEYSREGRVYMVKITPIAGPAYWYMDDDGDGQLELQGSNRGQGPVRPVYWKIKEW